MIGSTRNVNVWAYPQPCDIRKGHNGLSGLVVTEFEADLLSGDFFIFVNRRGTLMVQPPRQIGAPTGRAGERCEPEGIQCISVCHRSPRQPSVVHERATARGLSNRRLLGGKKGD